MDKKMIFILVLLAIIAIALIYYLKKNSESWKLQANLNLAFAKKLGVPIIDAEAEVITENKEEENQEETSEQTSEETTNVEPEPTTEPEPTSEPEPTTESEITSEPEPTSEPEVTAGTELTGILEPTTESEATAEPVLTVEIEPTVEPEAIVHTESIAESDPITEPKVNTESTKTRSTEKEEVIEPITSSQKKSSGAKKNKSGEGSERKVNKRIKKNEEDDSKSVNVLPLNNRVSVPKTTVPGEEKKDRLVKINELKKLQESLDSNKDLFDSNNESKK